MKRTSVLILMSMLAIYFASYVAAQTTLRNETLPTQLSVGSRLGGTITVIFNDENLDALLRTNFGQSISLRTLLELNQKTAGTHYNCSSLNCMPYYDSASAVEQIALTSEGTDVGFVLEGASVRNVRDVRLDIRGSSAPSCFPDLSYDMFNEGTRIVTSTRYTDQGCYVPRYGCFESDRTNYQSVNVPAGSASYCEKITLPAAPAFRVGARLTNSSSGSAALTMKLYQLSGTLLGQCTLPLFAQNEEELNCIVPRGAAAQEDYLVCISAGSASSYRIRAESNEPCGTTDRGVSYMADYEIFAQNLRFDSPNIELSDGAFRNATGQALLPLIQSYLTDRYNNHCQPNCIVPLRIFGAAQEVRFSNAFIRYDSAIGTGVESSSVYSLTGKNAAIDSGVLMLDLSMANFTIPQEFSGRTLELFIDNRSLVRKNVNVSAGFSFDLQPKFAAFARDTVFTIMPSNNISRTTWSFGDGSLVQSSQGATARHRYNTQGLFTIMVDATNTIGQTSRRAFNVQVSDPRSAVEETLALYERDLKSIFNNISLYPNWLQQELLTRLELAAINQTVAAARTAQTSAVNESDFVEIVNGLIDVRVPAGISITVRGTLPLSVGSENMDISLLKEMSDITISDESLRNSVLLWMGEHYAPQVRFETYSAHYGDVSEPVITKFTIDLNARGQRVPTQLVVGYPADSVRVVSSSSGNDSLSRGVSIGVPEGANSAEFSVVGMISPLELGAYLVPAQIDRLGDLQLPADNACNFDGLCSDEETRANCPSDCRPWGTAITLIVFILIIGALAYFGLRWWYAHRYENHLFKNKQDLYNLLNFIGNAQRTGMPRKDIQKKLKAAGWTSEQASYALSKYAGDANSAERKNTRKVY